MIAMIEGQLESIESGSALLVLPGGLSYQVLLPAYAAGRLGGSLGQNVRLLTLYYMESHNQGATLLPRLAGFLTAEDRAFFELFTTCKGIGNRKALRAMTMATAQIAAAIADRDVATLQTLPEVGRRTAETIVASLRDKVDRFLAPPAPSKKSSEAATDEAGRSSSLAREVVQVLVQLGENRAQAVTWVNQALDSSDQPPTDVQDLLARVYQTKTQ